MIVVYCLFVSGLDCIKVVDDVFIFLIVIWIDFVCLIVNEQVVVEQLMGVKILVCQEIVFIEILEWFYLEFGVVVMIV